MDKKRIKGNLCDYRFLKTGELIDRIGITGNYHHSKTGWYKVSRIYGEYGKTSLPSEQEMAMIKNKLKR